MSRVFPFRRTREGMPGCVCLNMYFCERLLHQLVAASVSTAKIESAARYVHVGARSRSEEANLDIPVSYSSTRRLRSRVMQGALVLAIAGHIPSGQLLHLPDLTGLSLSCRFTRATWLNVSFHPIFAWQGRHVPGLSEETFRLDRTWPSLLTSCFCIWGDETGPFSL